MVDFRRLRNGIHQFVADRQKGDTRAQLRSASDIFRGAADVAGEPAGAVSGDAPPDRLRLECLGLLSQLEEEANRTASVGPRGPAWDGTLLRIILEFLMQFLRPK